MIYRLVTANTIDQRIVERAAAKRRLEKMIIHKSKFKAGAENVKSSITSISTEELLNLLDSKDYCGVHDTTYKLLKWNGLLVKVMQNQKKYQEKAAQMSAFHFNKATKIRNRHSSVKSKKT